MIVSYKVLKQLKRSGRISTIGELYMTNKGNIFAASEYITRKQYKNFSKKCDIYFNKQK